MPPRAMLYRARGCQALPRSTTFAQAEALGSQIPVPAGAQTDEPETPSASPPPLPSAPRALEEEESGRCSGRGGACPQAAGRRHPAREPPSLTSAACHRRRRRPQRGPAVAAIAPAQLVLSAPAPSMPLPQHGWHRSHLLHPDCRPPPAPPPCPSRARRAGRASTPLRCGTAGGGGPVVEPASPSSPSALPARSPDSVPDAPSRARPRRSPAPARDRPRLHHACRAADPTPSAGRRPPLQPVCSRIGQLRPARTVSPPASPPTRCRAGQGSMIARAGIARARALARFGLDDALFPLPRTGRRGPRPGRAVRSSSGAEAVLDVRDANQTARPHQPSRPRTPAHTDQGRRGLGRSKPDRPRLDTAVCSLSAGHRVATRSPPT
ncbi:hypothetical protein CDD83_2903 [Cordyceps sp. RAO-2017]|nr:hypothetical protein CDD83_2903 [Cordyceps sp. RAO-2017]